MHTPNQGLTYTFKFSAVLIICSLYECSLPSVPFPLFPSRFPFPRSLPEAISGVCDSHESPPLQIYAFPSLLLFPLFPALFPYWWSCSHPPFLFSIMLPLPFPIFDYALTLSVPDVLMLLLQDCWKCNFCAVSAWVNGPDNYYLCTKLYSKVPHYFSAGEPSWNNECSRPLK
jgi:hypothetical protein